MAKERQYSRIGPKAFTANGTVKGQVTLSSTRGFKVNARVLITSSTQPPLDLKVKEVVSKNILIVAANASANTPPTDLSLYLVADGTTIEQPAQDRAIVPIDDQNRATYEQEPTLARRVINVDEFGNPFNEDNPYPVQIDGDIKIGSVNVDITDKESSPGANDYDIIRLGDGEDELEINADGSINVVTSPVKTPEVQNIPLAVAATEYTFIIEAGTKRFHIKNRHNGVLLISYLSNDGSNYFSLHTGSVYSEDVSLENDLTVYIQSTKGSQVVEVITWK